MSKHRKPGQLHILPTADLQPLTPAPHHVYQCAAIAYVPNDGATYQLGEHQATTPRLALRWLRARARDIVDQLDPQATRPTRQCLTDDQHHEHALQALVHGARYTYTIHDDGVRYVLSAQPTQTMAMDTE